MQIPFCGATYSGRSVNIDASRSINLLPEITGTQDNKTQMAMVETPGSLLFATSVTNTPVRGIRTVGSLLYAVIGNTLYSISTTGVLTSRGTLSTTTGRVAVTDNGSEQSGVGGNQIMITDGAAGYIYNTSTTTFSTISSAGGWTDLLDSSHYPQYVEYLDGYFIVINGTMSYWVSNLYDGTTYNALATASIIASSDNVVVVKAHRQQLFFMKETTTEVWYNAGVPTSTGSPFARTSGAVFDYGSAAKWSAASGGGSLFFLANQRIGNSDGTFVGVAEIIEYQPQVISTPAINWRIAQTPTLSECFGYCYTDEGHTYYVVTYPGTDVTFQDTGDTVTFTSDKFKQGDTIVFENITTTTGITVDTTYYLINKSGLTFQLSLTRDGAALPLTTDGTGKVRDSWTLCYDTTTKMWHERSSFNTDYNARRHVSNCYAYFNGQHMVGDYRNSAIYEMSTRFLTDNGVNVYRYRTAQTIYDTNELSDVFINLLAVDFETGVGNTTQTVVAADVFPAGDDHTTESRDTVTRTDISATATGFSTVAGDFSGMAVGSKILVSGFATTAINGSYTIESVGTGPSSIHTTVHPAATESAGASVTVYNYNDVLFLADGSLVAGAVYEGVTSPMVYPSWSNDGGHTWSSEYGTSLGADAAYTTRVRWRRLGKSNNRVFRVRISDAVKVRMLNAYVEAGRLISKAPTTDPMKVGDMGAQLALTWLLWFQQADMKLNGQMTDLYLPDQVNGKTYRITLQNGVLTPVEV